MPTRDRGNAVLVIIALIAVFAMVGGAFFIFLMRAPEPPVAPNGGASTGGATAVDHPRTDPEAEDPPTHPPDVIETDLYRGEVTDGLGKMIRAATISSGPFPSDDEIVVQTDKRGAFEILLPTDQSAIVRIEAPGYYRQVVELERAPEIPYLLFIGGKIRGVVRGPTIVDEKVVETPVPETRIEAAGLEGWFHEVTTDAEGRYSITAPPGALVLTVRSDEYQDLQLLDVEALRDGEVERDILLEPGIRLELTLFGDGEMVGDAHVRAITDMGQEGEDRTDGIGKLSFDGLAPGKGRLVIVKPGYQAKLHTLVLGDNRSLIRTPVTMVRSTPYRLEVVDAEGNARLDASVRIKLDRLELVVAAAGDSEALQILGPDRVYSFEVVAPGSPRVRMRFKIPINGPPLLRVVLPKGGRFRGRVVDTRDHPVAGAGVLISSVGSREDVMGTPRLTSTAVDGSFRTELFAPGSYRIQVHHPKLGRVGVETRMLEGEDKDVGTIRFE
jgi:hypothetical protein